MYGKTGNVTTKKFFSKKVFGHVTFCLFPYLREKDERTSMIEIRKNEWQHKKRPTANSQ
jgi:hypothetical protein